MFDLAEGPDGLLLVRLSGDFDEQTALHLEDTMRAALVGKPGQRNVLFDLCNLTSCSIMARSVLTRIQTELVAPWAKRTAYVADRALFRGLALWVLHVSADDNAHAVVDRAAAERWFREDKGRLADAQNRLASFTRAARARVRR
jgi:hypothetical protein